MIHLIDINKLHREVQHVTLGQQLVANALWPEVRHCAQETVDVVEK